MPQITLHPIAEADPDEILHFEVENQAHFERTVASFGDDYYELETIQLITAERARDWEKGSAYYYLFVMIPVNS